MTKASDLSPGQLIDIVLAYAKDNDDFDIRFVKSLQSIFEERGTLSMFQQDSLENVLHAFNIDIDKYLKEIS